MKNNTQYKKVLPYLGTAIIALVLGFFIGTKHVSVQPSQDFAGNQAMRSNRTSGGMGRMGGGAASGEIIAKDTQTLTIKLRDGGSKVVLYSPKTEVSKSVAGSADDAAVGKQVNIFGTANQDGSVSAQTIQIRPDMPQGQQPKN